MQRRAPGWLKPAVDYGPLAAFLAGYVGGNLFIATAALMAATLVALALSLIVARRVPVMAVLTGAVVGLFGGLTLWLKDDTFIKMKPTIIQVLLAGVLLGGLAFDKPLLKPLLEATWPMDEAGWRALTRRFALFFIVMAALNEVVWRTQSTDVWVGFKVFGILGLSFVFMLSQMPLLQRHHQGEAAGGE
jgi:intracellular septation protein